MDVKDIEIYSERVDHAVVKMPDRNTLGSVIQGDTLFLMHAEMMDVLEELKHNPGSDVFYRAYRLAKNLEERLEHYITVCEENGVELSFDIEFSVEDYEELLV